MISTILGNISMHKFKLRNSRTYDRASFCWCNSKTTSMGEFLHVYH